MTVMATGSRQTEQKQNGGDRISFLLPPVFTYYLFTKANLQTDISGIFCTGYGF